MRTTYVWGALVLGLALATVNSSAVLAQGAAEAQETKTVAITTSQANKAEILEKAKEAKKLAQQNPSTTYPGLDKYIGKLIDGVEKNKYANADEALAALEEATEAIPLLLEVKVDNNVAKSNAERTESVVKTQSQQNAKVETPKVETVQAQKIEVVETKSATTTETKTETKVEAKTVKANAKDEAKLTDTTIKVEVADEKQPENSPAEAKQDETVELPKTGEEKKAGVGVLILAGIVVVLATVGMTVLIVKGKKNA